ncbi:hypothetical protein NM688_g736 [Phlebia brevispora]|uniref:Uncharacterized protein n=1 Tax=Phlebia brevispora TaxID=194682 RepID=A0ACC1TD58_9APHY|nr:hypothetical protein NM688_g736 [Phlebia brevispora]
MDNARSADTSSLLSGFSLVRTLTGRSRDSRRTSRTALTSVPSHNSRKSAQSRLSASAQNLPVEVVVEILAYALPSIYSRATHFRSDTSTFYREVTHDFRSVLQRTQGILYRAALVCKAWYPVANELLYSCPFFSAHDSVVAFGRTLRAVPQLGQFVREAWFFNEEGTNRLDLMGLKRKNSQRVQADLSIVLRTCTSLDYFIVCNHGLIDHPNFPIDNILVYGLPSAPDAPHIPRLTLHGPAAFNEPWSRHAKPSNLDPQHLEVLCMRDIETSPAVVKYAPYLPTLPRLHTLQVYMRTREETPLVSSGTFPGLRTLEVYRDVFDNRRPECMRAIAVDELCLQKLDRLHLIGRALESALFRLWAEAQLLNTVRHLAIGLLHRNEHAFLADWRLPDKLETLVVVVWHDESGTNHDLGELGHAKSLLTALASCVQRNRQHHTFRELHIRATAILTDELRSLVRDLRKLCGSHGFDCQYTEGCVDEWISQRLSGSISAD